MKKYVVFWYEYPTGTGPYGSGGWSRSAKRRPRPVLKYRMTDNVEKATGKEWRDIGKLILAPFCDKGLVVVDRGDPSEIRKMKCVVLARDDTAPTGYTAIREDYQMTDIVSALGIKGDGVMSLFMWINKLCEMSNGVK